MNNKAFTLLETIFAVTILSVGILSVLSIVVKMNKAQEYTRHREIATFLSQEGIEAIMKKIEDNYNRCPANDNNLLGAWNCAVEVNYDNSNGCACSEIFSSGQCYKDNFDGSNWMISAIDCSNGLYQILYYNCPINQPCYYSHINLGSDSVPTIFERKIVIENTSDFNNDGYTDSMRASSAVRWSENGEYKYVTTTMDFYNWRWRKE